MDTAKKICSVAKKCGGCQFQGMAYAEQLKKKQKTEEDLLKAFGKVEPIIGMKDPYYYRNKMHRTFGRDRKGNAICGTYQEGTHKIVALKTLLMNTSISMDNLVVQNIYTTDNEESSSNGAMTITCKVGNTTVVLRTVVLRDAAGNLITFREYEGKTINVKGMVDCYDGEYQIKIFSANDITVQ